MKEMNQIPNRLLGVIESPFDNPSRPSHGAAGSSTFGISDVYRVDGKKAPSPGGATACMSAGG